MLNCFSFLSLFWICIVGLCPPSLKGPQRKQAFGLSSVFFPLNSFSIKYSINITYILCIVVTYNRGMLWKVCCHYVNLRWSWRLQEISINLTACTEKNPQCQLSKSEPYRSIWVIIFHSQKYIWPIWPCAYREPIKLNSDHFRKALVSTLNRCSFIHNLRSHSHSLDQETLGNTPRCKYRNAKIFELCRRYGNPPGCCQLPPLEWHGLG